MNKPVWSKTLIILGKSLLVLLIFIPCIAILWPFLDFLRDESMLFSSFRNSAAVADFDGDGDQDVLVLHLRNDTWIHITMWMNQGNGFSPGDIEWGPGFSHSGGLIYEGGIYNDVVTGDLEGDQDPDVLMLSPETLIPFINQGGVQAGESGLLHQNSPIHGPASVYQSDSTVILSDIDGDGMQDALVVGGCCGYNWSKSTEYSPYSWIWFNGFDTDGNQLQSSTDTLQGVDGLHIQAADIGDLDGDDSPDIFAVTTAGDDAKGSDDPGLILLNDGEGKFSDTGQRLGDFAGTAVSLGDLDADGDLDAVVGTTQGAVIWINQGGAQNGVIGQFTLSSQKINGSETRRIFLADVDRDADLDALIAGERRAVFWLNDGNGTFLRSNQRFSYTKRHGIALGDFNNDSLVDFFAGAYVDTPQVWINKGNGTFVRLLSFR